LVLNYFGQGALLLTNPQAANNPFYRLAPDWALYPLLVVATLAAIIASQAIISGSFSLTQQAVQLGYLPRVNITHTSATEIGQIYIPGANWALMVATLGVVFGFRSSSGLANAYGVALTTTMVITTTLAFFVTHRMWGWSVWLSGLVTLGFLIPDLSFLGANFIKIEAGGWFPLLVATTFYILMTTWKSGRRVLAQRLLSGVTLEEFLNSISAHSPIRVPGTAVFMTQDPVGTPTTLLHNLKHNKVLHEKVVLLTVITEDVPHLPDDRRLQMTDMGKGFYRVIGRYGFMEDPNVPELLQSAARPGLEFNRMETTYFFGRETLIPSKRADMHLWRKRLFSLMARNAHRATAFFRIPPNRVVELGAQVEL
jgi:KUP system potassium uptake protein